MPATFRNLPRQVSVRLILLNIYITFINILTKTGSNRQLNLNSYFGGFFTVGKSSGENVFI